MEEPQLDGRTQSLLEIERQMGVLIRRVRRMIRVVAAQVHPDLQPSAYLLLAYLYERDSCRSSDLVEAMGVDKGAVSRQIQHLDELGLVVRTKDPDDGRASLLTLTEDGRARLDAVREERREGFDRRLGGWDTGELATFAAQLARYNTAVESEVVEDPVRS